MDALERRVLLSAAATGDILSAIASPEVYLTYGAPGEGNLAPKDIKRIYGFNNKFFGSSAADGTGQTIAIVDAYNDPNITSDLNNFDADFGYASFTPTVVNQTGGSSLPVTDPTANSSTYIDWEAEESLDVEYAHALAPGASIVLVETNSPSGSDLLAGVTEAASISGVSVVSMSWGLVEGTGPNEINSIGEGCFDSVFSSHTGITFVAATGDHGSPGIFPAYSPYVLAVGGTSVTASLSGKDGTETTWYSGSSTAGTTGGGVSLYESLPSYQSSAGLSYSGRSIPDVSLNAGTPVMVYDSYDTSNATLFPDAPLIGSSGSSKLPIVYGFTGTSAAAPIWAALIAIADQGRHDTGSGTGALPLTGVSQTMPDLYAAYSNPTNYANDFHDITTGGNGINNAGTGYDLVTGLGTPRVTGILPALGATPTAAPIVASVVGLFTTSDNANTYNGDDLWTMDTVNDTSTSGAQEYTYGDLSYGMGGTSWVAVTGAWSGGSIKEMGIFNPTNGEWKLDTNGDGQYTSADLAPFYFGQAGDIPIVGDWNGAGADEVGVFRPSTGKFYLDYNGDDAFDAGDETFAFDGTGGYQAGDLPVAGHWGGSIKSEVGIFRSGTWFLDLNGDGTYDTGDGTYGYGTSGDLPVVGDWNAAATSGGNPIDEIGVYRPSNGDFILDYNGNYTYDSGTDEVFTFNTGTGLSTYDFVPISA